MNYRIITVVGIVSVLLVGGIAYWLMPKSDTQLPATNMPGGSDSGGFYQPSSINNSGAQPPNQETPVAAIDQGGVYDGLFKKLLAQRIVFERVSSGEVY